MKLILPCAGFGTRVDMKPTESKEMLLEVNTNTRIIDFALNIAKTYKIQPLVVSREEKTDLNDYLEKKGVETISLTDSKEWTDTIYKSHEYWDEFNIAILPDTRWDNTLISMDHFLYCLNELKKTLVLGTLDVTNPAKWCIVNNQYIEEKPKLQLGTYKAVGLFGFEANYGKLLFNSLTNDKKCLLPQNTQYCELVNFRDVTRKKSNAYIRN